MIDNLLRNQTLTDRQVERLETIEYSRLLGDVIGSHLALPELRAFWPFSSINESGNPIDLSGQARTLTNNGTTARAVLSGFTPYADLDGTNDYFSRADEAGLDITGALTMGGWFWSDATAPGTIFQLFGKWGDVAVNQRSYIIYNINDTVLHFAISSTGANSPGITSSVAYTTGVWRYVIGRFTPSTEIAIFDNGTKTTNTSSIPASIFNSTAQLDLGRYPGHASFHNGRMTLAFMCAAALSDDLITSLFNQSRVFFGV